MLSPSCAHPLHHASTCRWAVPAVLLPAPVWAEAERAPWACTREAPPRLLESTAACAGCPAWEARPRPLSNLPQIAG
jgi:hypothetical protein